MKKKIALSILLAATVSSLFASTLFSGETGIQANFSNSKISKFDPALNFDVFFAGQFSLSNALSVRGELSLETSDTYKSGPFTDTDSVFRIDEVSTSYVKAFGGFTHTLSMFLGYFETIGSQQFIKRQLGVQDFSSPVTVSYLGLNGGSVYSVFGFGGAYALKFNDLPISTGFVISRNNENEDDVAQLNIDWRFASSFRYFTIDLLAGIGAPLYTRDQKNNKIVLLIDTLYFHTGFDMLIGNRYSSSLFMQCGFEYLPIKSSSKSKEIEARDIYLLLEPRIVIKDLRLYLTAFSIPEEKIEKMSFIDDTLGINFAFFTNGLYTRNRDYSAGINWTVSFEGKNFKDITDTDLIDVMNIKVAPYVDISTMGGKLTLMFQANVTKFTGNDGDAMKLNIGYKKEL